MARLGIAPTVHRTANVRGCELGTRVEIGARCRLRNVTLGDYGYARQDAEIENARIGRFASIAAGVRIGAPNHPSHRAAQHPFTYRADDWFDGAAPEPAYFAERAAALVEIGHDVWVGHGAIVLPGLAIGTGSIVGAGAVVTRDVAPWAKVAGVPARAIGRRFAPETGARLERLAWWDWPHARLREALGDFRELSAEAFLDRHEGDGPRG